MHGSTLGVIITSREFFADSLAAEGRNVIVGVLEAMNISTVIVDEQETPLGAVETLSDSHKCAELFARHKDEIDGILVSLPNFGSEKGVADAIRLSGLRVPVLVHALPDRSDSVSGRERRDAYCGKLSVTCNLSQYGIPYSLTDSHVVDPRSKEFEHEILRFVSVCRVVRGLSRARIGAIGARPNAFQTVRFCEALLEANGISVSTVDLSEILGAAEAIEDDDRRVPAKLAEIAHYARADDVPRTSLMKMGKLSLAISDWITANEVNATAIQCWDSLQRNYGINACTVMSLMSEQMLPSACELDVMGAVSMYALGLAAGRPAALMDWNNNFNEEPDKCILFHCGNWPKTLAQDAKIIPAEILGSTLGRDNTWGALEGRPAPGPMTFARIHADAQEGVIRAYLGEGSFTADALSPISGNYAVVEIPELRNLIRFIGRNGFPHHGAMVSSHCASVLAEAFASYLGWEVYYHARPGG